MEQTYITAAFFRHLQYERYRAMEMAQYDEGHQQLAAGKADLVNPFCSICCSCCSLDACLKAQPGSVYR